MGPKDRRGVCALEPYSYLKLESWAAAMRRSGLPGHRPLAPHERLNAWALFENIPKHRVVVDGREVRLANHVVNDGVLPDGIPGSTLYDGSRIVVRITDSTHQMLEYGGSHAVWTAVHEFVHATLHAKQVVQRSEIPHQAQSALHRGTAAHAICYDTEWQADSAAAALLMPAAAIYAQGEPDELSSLRIALQFGVSPEAAGYRLDNMLRHPVKGVA